MLIIRERAMKLIATRWGKKEVKRTKDTEEI